jgi:hypothetical protein
MGGDVPVDSETFLMIKFVNLKIKPTQSFEYTHSDRMRVHRGEYSHIYIYINNYICTVFLRKKSLTEYKSDD